MPSYSTLLLATRIPNNQISFATLSSLPESFGADIEEKNVSPKYKQKYKKKYTALARESILSFHSAEFGCDLLQEDLCLFKDFHTYTADIFFHLLFVALELCFAGLTRPRNENSGMQTP